MSQTLQFSEALGGPCPARPSIWKRLEESAAKFPNRLAVASLHQAPDLYCVARAGDLDRTYLRWSYAQLDAAVNRFAIGLRRLGLTRGDTLATYLTNSVEFVISFWAAHRLGCTFAPNSPQSLRNDLESHHVLDVLPPAMVIVDKFDSAVRFDKVSHRAASTLKKILASNASTDSLSSWISFATLLTSDNNRPIQINGAKSRDGKRFDESENDECVTVLFTSGTTSVPKGAPHTDKTLNAFCENLSLGGVSEENVLCSVSPNNHAFGYFPILHFMMNGGAIVYPSPTFDAETMLEALQLEGVTHTALVPATLPALAEALRARDDQLDSSLVDVCLVGSPVTADNLRFVMDKLRSKAASTGFSMTEGSPVWTAPVTNSEELIHTTGTFSGRPSPGASVKICAQNSREPLPLGQPGELHQAGPGLIRSYLGSCADNDQFYFDATGRRWFITGDQAVMHPDGRVSITGRYKDIINRGGEKIAPAAMEAIIQSACGLEVQVVGAPDPVAGQVPVVIVKSDTRMDAKAIRDAVAQNMGPACAPDAVIALCEIGVDDFPRTASGKVQKRVLASMVAESMSKRYDLQQEQRSVKEDVLQAYSDATGIASEDLDLTASTTLFMDSIVSMRVRDRLRKYAGLILSMNDMAANPTIESQIAMLEKRDPRQRTTDSIAVPSQRLIADNRITAFDGDAQTDEAKHLKAVISKTIGTECLGYLDVADIIPAPDLLEVLQSTGIMDTLNFAIAVLAQRCTVEILRLALENALANNPIFTSFYVKDQHEEPYYATIKPCNELWNLCILEGRSLDDTAQLHQLAVNYPHPDHANVPGPLSRCIVTEVKETKSAGFVMYLNHLVHDASSLRLFLEDVNQGISDSSRQLPRHVDFRIWADSFNALRHSPAADVSVRFHVRHLRDLHHHKRALYPSAGNPRQPNRHNPDGLDYAFNAPDILHLKREYPELTGSIVFKAALALVNVSRTKYTHAVFNNFEAGRTRFPFIPSSLETLSPTSFEASDVNGPVMQNVCNVIKVAPEETAACFMCRLQAYQLELTKHAHAPLRRILDALRAEGRLADEVLVDVLRAQHISWIPGLLGEYKRLQICKIGLRPALGLVLIGSLGGPQATTFQCLVRWDGANFSQVLATSFLADLEAAILWLCETGNWNRPVKEYLDKTSR
ncbi:hypothetical protein HIM_05342 [Hirsutella minnesotensis 3608]|uniref:Carrier domain-containing protein n=1 Tax=Hirsutella minnesotensis 3608 TaxID=1043627 RepID=A0A0F7ZUN0_9HYPO|nr:hypothetical protein HIM_05342 [Hirsutella minnesotensis 3608]